MTFCECAHGRKMTSTHCVQLLCNDWQNYSLLVAGLVYCGHNRNDKYDVKDEAWCIVEVHIHILYCVYQCTVDSDLCTVDSEILCDPPCYPMVTLNVKISTPKVANRTFRYCKALASPTSFVNAPTHRRQRNRLHHPDDRWSSRTSGFQKGGVQSTAANIKSRRRDSSRVEIWSSVVE